MTRTVLRCFRCERRFEREMDPEAIAALTYVDHICPDCQTAPKGGKGLICPIWGLRCYRCN
jgi:hypothetical protein